MNDIRRALDDAIRAAGSEAKLADLTGVSQPAINMAKQRRRVSAALAVSIERAVGIPRERLCPQTFAPDSGRRRVRA